MPDIDEIKPLEAYREAIPDLSEVPEEAVSETLREGEELIRAQLQTALAADQRAAVLFSVFTTASLIVFAGVASAFQADYLPLGTTGLLFLTGITLVLAARKAAKALRPVEFVFPGSDPGKWYEDLHPNIQPHEIRADQMAVLHRSADRNDRIMRQNGKFISASYSLAITAASSSLFAALWWVLDLSLGVEASLSCLSVPHLCEIAHLDLILSDPICPSDA